MIPISPLRQLDCHAFIIRCVISRCFHYRRYAARHFSIEAYYFRYAVVDAYAAAIDISSLRFRFDTSPRLLRHTSYYVTLFFVMIHYATFNRYEALLR